MPGRQSTLSRVPGVRVGQAEDDRRRTGVTVVRFDHIAPTVIDVRGGASGTYDTASLALDATFGARAALFFAGGSLYGLDAALGVRRAILRDGGGVEVFDNPNRIVPISGAILFDLPHRRAKPADYADLGERAARVAGRGAVRTGPFGAGVGASVGKYLGRARAQAGGIGSVARRTPGGGWVGAIVAVNAVGAVREPTTGRWLAGPRGSDGRVVPPTGLGSAEPGGVGTTLVAVVTDRALPRPQLQRLAVFAHDALARAIVPAHAATDGDTVFVSSTASRSAAGAATALPPFELDGLGGLVASVVIDSIRSAVRAPPGSERSAPS